MSEPLEALLRDLGDLHVYAEGELLDLKKRLKLAAALLDKIPGSLNADMVLVHAEPPHPVITLTDSPLEFGRGSLTTGDAGLSRRHFLIEQIDGQAWISDCASRNGTWVNGARLSEPLILCDGDLVQASTSVLLFIRLTTDQPG